MGFNNEYRYYPGKYGYGLTGETILPFFGFTYNTEKIKRWTKEGGEITLSQNSFGDYKVGQNPTYYRDASYEVIIFNRKNEPIGKERALENRFIELAIESGKYQDPTGRFDERRLPYIPNSLSSYYYNNVLPDDSGRFIYLFPLLAFLVCSLISVLRNGDSNFVIERDALFVIGLPIVFFFVGWLVDYIRKKQIDRKELKTLTQKEKDKIKLMYFNHMKKIYGEEIGEVLKEYAILKGYDCN